MRNRRAIFLYAILGLLLLAPFSPQIYKKIVAGRAASAEQLSDEEQVELQHLMVKLKDRASACDYKWRQATTKEALVASVAGGEPCSAKLGPPTESAAKRYLERGTIDTFGIGGWSLAMVREGKIPDDEACTSFKTVADLSRGDGAHPPDRFLLLRARNKVTSPAEGLTGLFLVEHESTGKPMGGIPVPGFVDGKAFVYSEAEERVICAGAINAENTLDVTHTFDELQRDRELAVRRILGAKVTAVPRL